MAIVRLRVTELIERSTTPTTGVVLVKDNPN